jgi:hypothetical protein
MIPSSTAEALSYLEESMYRVNKQKQENYEETYPREVNDERKLK